MVSVLFAMIALVVGLVVGLVAGKEVTTWRTAGGVRMSCVAPTPRHVPSLPPAARARASDCSTRRCML